MTNKVVLTVDVIGDVEEVKGGLYKFLGKHIRPSGRTDEFYIFSPDKELGDKIHKGEKITFNGYLHSLTSDDNLYIKENRIMITDWKIEEADTYTNSVVLDGCKVLKVVSYRRPKDREDGMVLTVSLDLGENGGARATLWNAAAERLHEPAEQGKKLDIKGRLESFYSSKSNKLVWSVVSSVARVSAEK